jgi:hypothetical protein
MNGQSLFFGNRLHKILRDEAGGEDKSGGGGKATPAADAVKELSDLKASNAALLARLDALEKKAPTNNSQDDKSLADKVEAERKSKEKTTADTQKLEKALKFTIQSGDWVKTNASLLPKNIEGIFAQAEKENFATATEKADAIKVGIVSEFFSIQSNLDFLTETQKINLEDFKKLTKNDKQERVQSIYDTVFEPTFEMLKRVKKAEQLSKGLGDSTDSETAYKEKMKAISRKHYLGEKRNA